MATDGDAYRFVARVRRFETILEHVASPMPNRYHRWHDPLRASFREDGKVVPAGGKSMEHELAVGVAGCFGLSPAERAPVLRRNMQPRRCAALAISHRPGDVAEGRERQIEVVHVAVSD